MFSIKIDFEKEKNFVHIDIINNIYKQELKYPIDNNLLFKPISSLICLRVLELEQNRFSNENRLQYLIDKIEQFNNDYFNYISNKINEYLEEEYLIYINKK
jgi:hypothetical protein